MITRIVKMTFKPEYCPSFLEVFQRQQAYIAASEGCISLILMRDCHNGNVYFTISTWASESLLNKYRDSSLFEETWAEVKKYFSAKPEAWSLEDAT